MRSGTAWLSWAILRPSTLLDKVRKDFGEAHISQELTSYVPPAPNKLVDMMESHEQSIDRVEKSVIKAIPSHYFFVTIHPYIDGNGMRARLLMNYILLASGYEWITIRAEQRKPYFDVLAEGQLHEDILPFGKIIMCLMNRDSGKD